MFDIFGLLGILNRQMATKLKVNEMTTEEKLQVMELLWDDLCRNAPDFSSPTWHEDILKEREKRLKEGKEKFVDWNKAKKELRELIPQQ